MPPAEVVLVGAVVVATPATDPCSSLAQLPSSSCRRASTVTKAGRASGACAQQDEMTSATSGCMAGGGGSVGRRPASTHDLTCSERMPRYAGRPCWRLND
jgi:hypothetical protein